MILTIGDAIIDETIELETVRQCPEGDWPIVREVNRYTRPGGASAIDAMVSALGEECQLIHSDHEPTRKVRTMIDGCFKYRIDYDRIGMLPTGWYCPDPSVVLIADYGKGAIDRSVIQELLQHNFKVIVDPHPSQDPTIYHGVYGITPNRNENQIHGYAMRKEFPRFCLKRDKDGMVASEHGLTKHYQSTAVEPIVDGCGAGDQVLASLGTEIAGGAEWFEACRLANEAAGRQCGVVGAVRI